LLCFEAFDFVAEELDPEGSTVECVDAEVCHCEKIHVAAYGICGACQDEKLGGSFFDFKPGVGAWAAGSCERG
jgi:hypothetical protein